MSVLFLHTRPLRQDVLRQDHARAHRCEWNARQDLDCARRRHLEWPCAESRDAFETAEQWHILQLGRLARAERELRRRGFAVPAP
jgi:hypothetical protein